MGIFARTAGSMHNLTIILLSFLIVLSSYFLGQFPTSVIIALATVLILEIPIIRFYKKHVLKVPYSGIITALIIGSVAPQNASPMLIVVASALAVAAIFAIRTKNGNIFNPAAFGLLVALAVFSVGDAWWAASASVNLYSLAIPFALLLALCAYEARRLLASLCFVAASLAIGIIFSGSFSPAVVVASFLGINFFFGFVMLPEPKTSPHKAGAQAVYGIGIAILYALLAISKISYPFLIALLVGNVVYAIYRKLG